MFHARLIALQMESHVLSMESPPSCKAARNGALHVLLGSSVIVKGLLGVHYKACFQFASISVVCSDRDCIASALFVAWRRMHYQPSSSLLVSVLDCICFCSMGLTLLMVVWSCPKSIFLSSKVCRSWVWMFYLWMHHVVFFGVYVLILAYLLKRHGKARQRF